MSFTGRTIIMHDFSRPLAERARSRKVCGPYMRTVGAPIDGPHTAPSGIVFYLGSDGQPTRYGGTVGLRVEPANDCLPPYARLRDTRGYYLDDDCHDTAQPIVARLSRGRGFLAGWTLGPGMLAELGRRTYGSDADAAYAAHSFAERVAENEREYQREQDELEHAGAE